ncbi:TRANSMEMBRANE PROTEIN [Salix viminalis]|uniref:TRANSMEMBRANE PROTEIN n=1 Tax=Salix viminalis TaxID=40686 RepID=A0A9Q0QK72_SALVM|nr:TRANSMEMBRANE PROTEIN [Salix viminalis]
MKSSLVIMGAVRLECRRNPSRGFRFVPAKLSCDKHVLYAGRGPYQLSHEDDLPQKPFWLSFIKEAIWAWKALFVFLVEQPSQLKYIEWPGFQSTLRTAMLTLVLVALLIVALSSVDSVLCYVLALLLRRSP